MTETISIRKERYVPTDPRLGRNLNHDSRSLAYQVEAAPDISKLKSIRHDRHIPILNQGSYGSCTGNAATACMAMGVFWRTPKVQMLLSQSDAVVDENYAISVYSDATKLDPFAGSFPPTDTGSDGLSVAKVVKNRGLISGYNHAMSFEAAVTALAEKPVISGIKWFADMFEPTSEGRIRVSGSLKGGHEFVLSELDVENQRIWMDNSWTIEWGIQGRAWFSWDDFAKLLDNDGDITVFVPNSEPPPQPKPPAPPTPPAPTDPKAEFRQAVADYNKASASFNAALAKFLGP